MSNIVRGLDRTPTITELDRILAEDAINPRVGVNPDGSLTTTSQRLSALGEQVAALEDESRELGEIRATLLVNFGEGRKHDMGLKDAGHTSNMLMTVLEKLVKIETETVRNLKEVIKEDTQTIDNCRFVSC